MPTVICDTETYENYFLAAFKNVETGEVIAIERVTSDDGTESPLDVATMKDIMVNDCVVTFNGANFDLPVIWAAIAGRTNAELKAIADDIIVRGARPWEVARDYRFVIRPTDHIDLKEVAPLMGSLKAYAGRLHAPRIQDLPYAPDLWLTPDQIATTRDYCINSDIPATELLLHALEEPLALRASMSAEYGEDLRSKSDAQIAEAVIAAEARRMTGKRVDKPEIEPHGEFFYQPPAYINFQTANMRRVLEQVSSTPLGIDYGGRVNAPEEFGGAITIGDAEYKIGIGGLHSRETCRSLYSGDGYTLVDRDVASYYPALIVNADVKPPALGDLFVPIYDGIRQRRLAAKQAKNKVVAESLKIVLNGTFGKLGQPYSIFYSPKDMIQVTLTGQLALLMAIERLEEVGIRVVSGNTDGFTSYVHDRDRETFAAIIAQWETETGLETEEAIYRSLHSRDINGYLAIKEDGTHKGKNLFFDPWSGGGKPDYRGQLSKNPQNTICVSAVVAHLRDGVPLADTIRQCSDVTRFVTVRKVEGGATWRGDYVGKVVRWYYATDIYDCMRYAGSNNRVPKSDGCRPLMVLPDALPSDVDYDWYVREAESLLVDIGAVRGPRRRGEDDERQVDMFAAMEVV